MTRERLSIVGAGVEHDAGAGLRLTSASRREHSSGIVLIRKLWTGPAVATIVAEARYVVTGFAAGWVPEARLADIKTCVSEAVANAVVHAYDDGRPAGTISISAAAGPDSLTIVVTDDGVGFKARTDSPGLGLGLPLIGTLSDSLSVARAARGGTEVSIRFDLEHPHSASRAG